MKPPRFSVRYLMGGVVVLAIVFAAIRPFIHIPTHDERRAIRAAVNHYSKERGIPTATVYNIREIGASRRDGKWMIGITSVANPEPGGLRTTEYFSVDARGNVAYSGLIAGGSY